MKMNQWVDFDIGDEAQSENVFSYMGKTYSIELSLSVGFGDIWFANLYSVTGDKKQKCVSNIKIPTCDFDELSWLKRMINCEIGCFARVVCVNSAEYHQIS